MTTAELKRQITDELFRVHVGRGDGCALCEREGATWTGCPIVDEAVERLAASLAPIVGAREVETAADVGA